MRQTPQIRGLILRLQRNGRKALSYLLHGSKVRGPQAVLVVPVSLALHRVKTVTPTSRVVDTRLTKKGQRPAERDTINNTPPKHEGDEYVRFDTETKACHKLDLKKGMVKNVNEKFTTYVKDKSIHETVLDSNPVASIDCLKTQAVDDYLVEIFESLRKSYGRESDNNLSKVQSRLANVMGPLGKLWLTLEKVRTGQ